mmetsp:Transcript_69552/g.165893  ORF Transcript_69552/g.165893 Transcript_69552/m.165893 type:complete len:270 (+) Transcript_69552:998-1807(+)
MLDGVLIVGKGADPEGPSLRIAMRSGANCPRKSPAACFRKACERAHELRELLAPPVRHEGIRLYALHLLAFGSAPQKLHIAHPQLRTDGLHHVFNNLIEVPLLPPSWSALGTTVAAAAVGLWLESVEAHAPSPLLFSHFPLDAREHRADLLHDLFGKVVVGSALVFSFFLRPRFGFLCRLRFHAFLTAAGLVADPASPPLRFQPAGFGVIEVPELLHGYAPVTLWQEPPALGLGADLRALPGHGFGFAFRLWYHAGVNAFQVHVSCRVL